MALIIEHRFSGAVGINVHGDGHADIVAKLNQIITSQGTIMSSIQDLNDKFDAYIAARDVIDAAKDAASAEKDATIATLIAQHAADVAAGADNAAAVVALQAGVDAAVAKEQAALDALTPPTPPVVVEPPVVDPVPVDNP